MEQQITTLNLGIKIRFFRDMKGLSQQALAMQLGISQQAYQKIESGVTKLDVERANVIANELGVQLDFLISFSPANYWYQCTLSGNTVNNNIPKELLEAHQSQIQVLKEEVLFLRELLKGKL
ncbi:helix-turn-helix domain-containing protein [Fluviicola taffensis]|jgi:transcriptional regulator with XRE-family HTH domain|uniref:Helix-turn-helix domain protein n=1 Tax=Fluviicola taffensis (strain DSM 16823 / NCIMB 13979 / RW262) TaxID=755732 RepID=F2IBH7_FLUTR|nr:helix-turn-helix transcriptional regulator [Fluviicola taffensis]AEA44285.1 helix-turn-helix domain protein [Fluviicola taffensis DSM 16823]